MAEPLPYKSLLVELARREVASQQVGQGDACGPVVHALHREGVHAGVEVADHRSHVEEARDGLVVCVERLQVDVGARAAQDDEKHRLVGAAVEGPVGDADELLGRLVEVGVLPCGAQLVVMVHRVHGRLGEAELGDELLDGVRLDDAVAV